MKKSIIKDNYGSTYLSKNDSNNQLILGLCLYNFVFHSNQVWNIKYNKLIINFEIFNVYFYLFMLSHIYIGNQNL